MTDNGLNAQVEKLTRGTVDVISKDEFKAQIADSLKTNKPLRVKYGADPSSPDLHLGHTVPLRKLRQFQDFGHTVVFIIGDFTARIGDPTHRSETRPMLSAEDIKRNAETYQEQVFKILDKSKTEVRYNSEWLDKLKPQDFLHLTAQYTVARLLERDDFHKRYKANQPIAVIEFLYPLMQGYDSVIVKSDLELGGTDQKFNLLVGRELQKVWGQKPQTVMTMPLLEGTDGVRKMSKSFGNSIGVKDEPNEMFGKIMSIQDAQMEKYFQALTNAALQAGSHPREEKARLAREIVSFYHGAEKARQASEHFDTVFRDKGMPDEMPLVKIPAAQMDLANLLKEAGLVTSKSEGRRLVEQGGVKVNQETVKDWAKMISLEKEVTIQAGKRKFAKVIKG